MFCGLVFLSTNRNLYFFFFNLLKIGDEVQLMNVLYVLWYLEMESNVSNFFVGFFLFLFSGSH